MATGWMWTPMAIAGNRGDWIAIGALIPTATGAIRTRAGRGFPTRTSAPSLITMGGGFAWKITAGSGSRITNGARRGSPGGKVTITSAGHRSLRMLFSSRRLASAFGWIATMTLVPRPIIFANIATSVRRSCAMSWFRAIGISPSFATR